MKKSRLLPLFLFLFVGVLTSQAAVFVGTNSTFRYFKGTQEASTPRDAWRFTNFDDSTWLTGDGAFYFDSDLTDATGYHGNTQLTDMNGFYSCIFLRKTFVVSNVNQIASLTLAALSDDGYVAWINGQLVTGYNMPTTDPLFNGTANAALTEPLPIVYNPVSNPSLILNEGTNVLAIQAFNSSLGASSDFIISASLFGGTP